MPKTEPLRLLVLGGTSFIGPAMVECALSRGHSVTIFHRGKTRPGYFGDRVVELIGDRDPNNGDGLGALAKGEWDAVIDTSGYFPRLVKASAELLTDRVGHYIFISSISAYRLMTEFQPAINDESAPLAELTDPTVETMGTHFENYGGLKALCEQVVQQIFSQNSTIVRPGYIVGPNDPTGRFTYWPVRADLGGEMAIPGAPNDQIQVIDVRDLGQWLVFLVENKITGIFNACGPRKEQFTIGELMEICHKIAEKKPNLTWIPADFIEKEGVNFPIWAPPKYFGFHDWKIDRALNAGLKFRPIEETVRETLLWYKNPQNKHRNLAGPDKYQEEKLLQTWQNYKSGK